jgi:hypothetical protein
MDMYLGKNRQWMAQHVTETHASDIYDKGRQESWSHGHGQLLLLHYPI